MLRAKICLKFFKNQYKFSHALNGAHKALYKDAEKALKNAIQNNPFKLAVPSKILNTFK